MQRFTRLNRLWTNHLKPLSMPMGLPLNGPAGVELTASDGEARVIGAGEVVLVEDTTGRGHLSKSVNDQMRPSIFVPIE